MKKSMFILVFLLSTSLVWAVGNFNMLTTRYVDVLYEDGLEMAAYRLYQKADEIFERLEKRFESSPKIRPKVYLLRSDVSNGYANPLNNVIVIYVSDMNPYQFTPRYDDWVIFCFRHELAHIFLANRFSPKVEGLSFFGHAVAAAVQNTLTPLYLHEGVAIMEESAENEGRANDVLFDLYRRNALASDIGLKFASSINTTRFTPGGANYTLGYTLLESLEKREEGTVKKLLDSFSNDPLLGFSRHLKKFVPLEEVKGWLNAQVFVEGERLTELSLIPSKLNFELWRIYYAFGGYDAPGAIYFYDVFEGKSRKLIEVSNLVSFSVNSRRELAIVRTVLKNGRYVNRLYLWKGSTMDTGIEHVIDVAWFGDDRLALIVQKSDARKITVFDVKTNSLNEIPIPNDLAPLQIAADENRIVFTARKFRNVDLYMLQDARLEKLTIDGGTKLSPIILNDQIYFVAELGDELRACTVDLRTNQIHEFGVKDCVAAVGWNGKIFSIKPLPGGYALFSEPANVASRGSVRFETVFVIVSEPEKPRINSTKYSDAMRFRFFLPFPYVELAQKDFGAGAYLGFWDDLMDNTMVVGFAKTLETGWLQLSFNSSKGFAASVTANDKHFALDMLVSETSDRSLKAGTVFSAMGVTIEPEKVLPKLSIGYAYGSVGGLVHLKRFPEFSFTVGVLPEMFFELSRAFNFRQILFEVRGRFDLSGLNFSAQTVLPAIRTNIGSFDGFVGFESFALSFGMTRGQHEEYWMRVDMNVHVSYQIPLKPFIKIGLRDGRTFLQFGFDDILSGILGVSKDRAIISTAR
ncbi:hypothetical protein AS159_03925 [Thermotoga sp. Ku-13t]|uniref:hypothetical protein n=1 Tax=Thermotoga sp. Ku-13t TaxID=1755813 RepID=UPI0013EB152C|nr:hypothetical protein [Thermotoga sp. Ku-13t]KAF2958830.1 hypothetical protein AS159_03925 [Thermotoga sp. Ku-13t]